MPSTCNNRDHSPCDFESGVYVARNGAVEIPKRRGEQGNIMGKSGGSAAITFADGNWHQGDPKVVGIGSHAMWLSSVAFDGARSFDGWAPDLDLHCARVVRSAEILGLNSPISAAEIEALAWEGIAKFPPETALYITPMLFAEEGFVIPEPDSTRFAMGFYPAPMPEPNGFSACLTRFRRPTRDAAPTEAKASCLYPNVARMGRDAQSRGFDMAICLDPNGNVAEFGYQNLFFAADGVVHTPAPNGTFLNGITRQRVIGLLRADGVEVVERAIDYDEVKQADEIFSTGNFGKVLPCTRIEERSVQPGPLFRRARELYFDFASTAAAKR
jgi:branched-chain amino acid aminotransferase